MQRYNKKMIYANKKEKKRLPPARRTEGNSYESILTTGGTRTTGGNRSHLQGNSRTAR